MSEHLKAVIFDWAGTVVDFGCRAPVAALIAAFARFGVVLPELDARAPMGLPKWEHVTALFARPTVAALWRSAHGRMPTPADIQVLYEVFIPLNRQAIHDHAELIPGVAGVSEQLRSQGLKIGSTTGYTRELMDELAPLAAAQGFSPDNLVCAGDLPYGRPTPMMIYKCFLDLGVFPAACVVKVDDTVPGLLEGAAAGTWTVGVTLSGNEAGISRDHLAALSAGQIDTLRKRAAAALGQANPSYVIDTVAGLARILNDIEARLKRGERPGG